MLLEALPHAGVAVDLKGRIVHVNTQADAMFGYAPAELIGQLVEVLMPERFRERHVQHRTDYVVRPNKRMMGQGLELWGRRKNGSEFSVDISLGPIEVDGRSLVLSVIRDVTEQKQAERRLTAQHAVTRVLVESASFDVAAPKIIQQVSQALGWDVGGIWLVDEKAGELRLSGFWNHPALVVSEFEGICRRITFKSGVGLPGRVWASRQPAWIPNVQEDVNFPRAPYAVKDGLHGAFGFPIMLQERVFGVMEFFSREIREPDHALLQMFAAIGSQIGLFTQRKLAEQALQCEKSELAQMNGIMMDREERILGLKEEINALLKEMGRPRRYS